MKKLIPLLLALLLLLLLSGLPALAEEAAPEGFSGDYEYTLLDDGTARITKYTGEAEDLTLPAELDGHPVTQIGDYAFSGCDRLTSLTLPDSVAEIGANSFAGCRSLGKITVSPDSPALATIDGVLFSKADKRLVCYPSALEASSYEVPQGIAIIGSYAFSGCSSLTSLTLPDSLTAIGDEAFYSCDGLTDLTLPGSVTTIGDGAFAGCTELTAFALPDSVAEIGANPFAGCRSLGKITVSPDSPALATIDGVLLGKADRRLICYPCALAATSYEVPQGVAVIGDGAFYGCSSLTSLTLPDGVTEIGVGAFWECESLTDLVIPDSVTQIADYAFYECPNLTVTVGRDSCAKDYCEANGIPYTYADANDWLNS